MTGEILNSQGRDTVSALQFPCAVFKTQRRMDDYGASDMCCGDLTESQLKQEFHLVDVSTRANPWALTKLTPFNQPQSMFYGSRGAGEKITQHECAKILFNEFRHLSNAFSFHGPYRFLMEEMITHMQCGQGSTFCSVYLNSALKEHILNDNTDNSSLLRLKKVLIKNIDWDRKCYPTERKGKFKEMISGGRLPRFDRFQDNVNGMGITVHDTWATHITIKSLQVDDDGFQAVVHYRSQDHFGLDGSDILKNKFYYFRLFRIWFVLQRCNKFGFKPFMTNIEATVKIAGGRDEYQK